MVYHCHKKIYYQINSILSNLFYLAMNFFLIFIVLIITQLCCRQYPGTRQGMDGNVSFISAFMCSVCVQKNFPYAHNICYNNIALYTLL